MELENLLSQIGEKQLAQAIGVALPMMAIVEGEIDRAQAMYPDKLAEVDAVFLAANSPILFSMPVMTTYNERSAKLFRLHCQQLIRNIIAGVDLDRPTMTEVAFIATQAAQRGPLHPELAIMVFSDKETMGVFDLDPVESFGFGEEFWPILTRLCVVAYTKMHGKPRSDIYAGSLKRNKEIGGRYAKPNG
jgi:hypothetical protein